MRQWAIAIFVAVFAWNLVTTSREPAWGDARPMWDVAAKLVKDGSLDIKTRWPEDLPPGRGGKTYGIAPIGPGLSHVPGAALAALAHDVDPKHDVLFAPLAAHVAPSALGALAAMLMFLLLCDLGVRVRTASLCAAILVLATTTWVYAHYPYSEILQLACFLGLFRQTLRVCDAPPERLRREALWFGAWAGLALNSKYVLALAIAGAAATIAWSLRKQRRELMRAAGWAAITGVPFVVLALTYNWLRWGSVTSSGYEAYLGAYFGGSVFDGLWGMLASPNKSALLYSPPLVLALFGLPAAIRAKPRYGLALAVMVVPTFLVYCTYRSWSGDYAWGPRFFVWLVPVLLVPLAWFIDEVSARWHRRVRVAILASVVVAGFAVQVLGTSLYWDHFIRIAIDAKNQWLGNPNRGGAYVPAKGRPHCDSCFEDTYEVLWTPAFHPIRGHWWLLKSIARDDDERSAQADAPWRTYTTLVLNLSSTYPRARLDWWGMLWIKDAPHTRTAGITVFLVLVLVLAFGVWRWLRLHRAATSV